MSFSQYFYADSSTDDVEEGFFRIINTHAGLASSLVGGKGMTITEPTIEAARQSELDNGFKDPLKVGSKLYRVTVERVNG